MSDVLPTAGFRELEAEQIRLSNEHAGRCQAKLAIATATGVVDAHALIAAAIHEALRDMARWQAACAPEQWP